jgi:hypothetical protein
LFEYSEEFGTIKITRNKSKIDEIFWKFDKTSLIYYIIPSIDTASDFQIEIFEAVSITLFYLKR